MTGCPRLLGLIMVFDPPVLASYLAACVVLVLIPGPAQMLVLTRVASGGWRAGIATSLGLNVGTLVHTVAAAVGLSAILATSAVAFSFVKYLGAGYLIYLGYRAWREGDREQEAGLASGRSAFGTAVITGVLNPKVALFFLAFLPQFVDPDRGWVVLQFIVLGVILGTIGLIWDSTLSLLANLLTGRLLANTTFKRWRQRITGTVLVGLGLRLAVTSQR